MCHHLSSSAFLFRMSYAHLSYASKPLSPHKVTGVSLSYLTGKAFKLAIQLIHYVKLFCFLLFIYKLAENPENPAKQCLNSGCSEAMR